MKIHIYPKSMLETVWQQDKLLFTPEAEQPPLCLRCGQPLDHRLVINALSRYAAVSYTHLGGICRMKETSQRYLNSEAHGYLMEAKACKLLLKDLERIRAKLRRHIEKEAADREAEFEAVMQYHSESDIQEAYGWEFISEQQYEH